jgi:Coenzyme PQQ synthesis protein D (PqqD)
MTDERPRQRSELSVRVVGDEVIVLDRSASQVHQLNVTAGFIWQRCDGNHTAGRIADEVASAFGVDADTARDAVSAALQQFGQLGLLGLHRD